MAKRLKSIHSRRIFARFQFTFTRIETIRRNVCGLEKPRLEWFTCDVATIPTSTPHRGQYKNTYIKQIKISNSGDENRKENEFGRYPLQRVGRTTDDGEVLGSQVSQHPLPPRRHQEGDLFHFSMMTMILDDDNNIIHFLMLILNDNL